MTMSEFFSPKTHQQLAYTDDRLFLEGPGGERYRIIEGIPELLLEAGRQEAKTHHQDYYRMRAAEYDQGSDVMFRMLLCEEDTVRRQMISMLRLTHRARILEIGCGTCRDTLHLLSEGAFVYASDLSCEMVMIGRARLDAAQADFSRLRLFLAEATRLPFPDGYFDAVFHFGGLNVFPDIEAALLEMTRVVKSGGRVVAGDEGIGPWLSNTEFAKILQNSNPLFRHHAPLEKIPIAARDVTCRWILNGSFYLLAFDVGANEPPLDLDVEFPGWRGGSHRRRYFGKLEGVNPDLRDKVVRAAAAEGISVVKWLERALGHVLNDEQ